MKRSLLAVLLLVTMIGLSSAALAETAFDSSTYLGGEAGLIAPLDKGETLSTDLSGPVPNFDRDYNSGEGGILEPIAKPMEKIK